MRRALAVLMIAGVSGLTAGATLSGTFVAPTAQCKDGTYSYSQTHSGTCSGHGGVAVWLDSTPAAPVAPSAPAPQTTPTPQITPAAQTTTSATTTPATTTPPVSSPAAPTGATALCRDGTYSFSQHHSGTCSYHGGVAQWLAGSTASSSGAAAPASSSAVAANSTTAIDAGTTVLLGSRTITIGCTLGSEPDRTCSPGAYSSSLTTAVICSGGFHTSTIRNVPQSEKYQVEQEYGLAPSHYGSTLEIDHIVPLELGGSNDIANLFPERASGQAGYRAKDRLENRLHELVCSGGMRLNAAQRQIAANWALLYRHVYGSSP